jgi:hypothetical protein
VGASEFDEVDFAEADRLLPHSVYAAQGYVTVVNPGKATTELAFQLLPGTRTLERAAAPGSWKSLGGAGPPSGSR